MRPNRPNVILIVTDDQGYGDMACRGNPVIATPHLDRLHGECVRLTDYHVDPMCAPSRAAILTGRYSARTGVWSTLTGRYIMRQDEVTMAQVFAASGYRTAMFGKWHLGDTYPYRPQDRGFHESLTFGGGVIGEIQTTGTMTTLTRSTGETAAPSDSKSTAPISGLTRRSDS